MRKISANDELMTTREAGETLGVAVRTVQLWVEAGVLPAWRTAGGHRRIARSAVEKLMQERAKVLAPAPDAASGAPTPANALRLLLVEDDVNLRLLFSMVVEGWDFPVELVTASNGFDGLIRIGKVQPDMVITDLNMPGMDGFQMVRSLKKKGSGYEELNLVVVTALGKESIKDRGGLPPGIAVFQKPVDFGKLEILARKLLVQKAHAGAAQA